MKTTQRKCSLCHVPGHNSATCTEGRTSWEKILTATAEIAAESNDYTIQDIAKKAGMSSQLIHYYVKRYLRDDDAATLENILWECREKGLIDPALADELYIDQVDGVWAIRRFQ